MKSISRCTFLFLIGFLLLQSCSDIRQESVVNPEIENDSIAIWIKASQDNSIPLEERKQGLLKAQKAIESKPENVESTRQLRAVAFRFAKLRDTIYFKKINDKVLRLGTKYQDSSIIAKAYWGYAEYYIYQDIFDKAYLNYNTAYKYYVNIEKKHEAGRMLFAMAWIKGQYNDYTGREVLLYKALEKFKSIDHSKRLRATYNAVALLNMEIGEYNKAIFFFNKSANYISKLSNNEKYYEVLYNNLGYTYFLMGKYGLALENFNKALDFNSSIYTINYANIIDNMALCRLMLNDTINVEKDFFEAMHIKDSIKHRIGISDSKILISEYYSHVGDTVKSHKYAKEAYLMANKFKNSKDYLRSLKQLAKIDSKNAQKYLDRYIRYNDSLVDVERKAQNKFTRIEFETDEYIEETERLSEQKIWILFSGLGTVLILSLLYFLRVQKSKNEKLVLEAEQQKANEQLYQLTIEQQSILEEEKIKERNRISEELHDGILGRLFGTRMGLGFFEVKGDKKQHQSFLEELQEIEKDIREVSHKLHTSFQASEFDFSSIIEQLLKDKARIGQFTFNLDLDPQIQWDTLDKVIKVAIYRILQESLQNIIKHSEANDVTLTLSLADSYLIFNIVDNGIGFENGKNIKGIGLKNIASRVKKLKGNLVISSEIGKGTTILIKIPM